MFAKDFKCLLVKMTDDSNRIQESTEKSIHKAKMEVSSIEENNSKKNQKISNMDENVSSIGIGMLEKIKRWQKEITVEAITSKLGGSSTQL